MEGDYKEVFFDIYCETCKSKNVPENEDPCFECLAIPARIDSHKPEKYEKNEKVY